MIHFPDHIYITMDDGKSHVFNIVSIAENVVALTNTELRLIKNDDYLTFGYIAYKDGFLYAYAVTSTDEVNEHDEPVYDYTLIYMVYIGPDDVITDHNIVGVLTDMGRVFVRYGTFQNQHPGTITAERFQIIYDTICTAGTSLDDHMTPYIHTIKDLATRLRDYYIHLVDALNTVL